MKIMTGLVMDNNMKVGMIETSYYSKQLKKMVYKVLFYEDDGKIKLSHYKFVPEDKLIPADVDSTKFNWKNTAIKKMLDNSFQASIIYNTQVIKTIGETETQAFDKLYDQIEVLTSLKRK